MTPETSETSASERLTHSVRVSSRPAAAPHRCCRPVRARSAASSSVSRASCRAEAGFCAVYGWARRITVAPRSSSRRSTGSATGSEQ